MGPEYGYLGSYLLAAGTAAQMYGQHEQNKKQRKILNQAIDKTTEQTQDANAKVLDEAKKFTPADRANAMQQAEQAAFQQAQTDVGQGAAANIPQASGAVSSEYLKAKADRALSEGNRLTSIAREAAKVRAPGALTREEAMRRAALSGELGSEWSTRRNMGQAAQQEAAAVDMPWYGDLGKIASAVGSAMLMSPSSAAGSAGATGATNAALAESAAGLGGYGVSSASTIPWWQRAATMGATAAPRIRFGT